MLAGWLAVAFQARELSRECGSSSATLEAQCAVFLQQCNEARRVNRITTSNNGCAVLWRRCKVISSAQHLARTLTLAQVFEQLKKPVDPKVIEQRERELNERAQSQYERAQRRQADIVRRARTEMYQDPF